MRQAVVSNDQAILARDDLTMPAKEAAMRRPDQYKRALDALLLRQLAGRLDNASEQADYELLLRELEPGLPIAEATPDLPLFSVLPTTFEDRERWHELLSGYSLDDDVLTRLFEAGFVPLDRESAEFGVVGDPFPTPMTGGFCCWIPSTRP
jgi:hypothetical protein